MTDITINIYSTVSCSPAININVIVDCQSVNSKMNSQTAMSRSFVLQRYIYPACAIVSVYGRNFFVQFFSLFPAVAVGFFQMRQLRGNPELCNHGMQLDEKIVTLRYKTKLYCSPSGSSFVAVLQTKVHVLILLSTSVRILEQQQVGGRDTVA